MELNVCVFSGYAVSPMVLKSINGSLTVGELSLAINENGYTRADGTQRNEYCNFVNITVFGNYATSLSKMIEKGTPLLCQCHLKQNRWEKDGQKRSEIIFLADIIKVLPKKEKAPQIPQAPQVPPDPQKMQPQLNGDNWIY